MSSRKASTRTVHTPVFNTPRTPETLMGYLGNLSKEHVVLAHTMTKMPPSLCDSLTEEDEVEDLERKARVEALCKRVQEAYKHANGDPTDGKWGLLVQLLRMPSVKGRARWIGSTMEARNTVSNNGWINARSEGEWFEWERGWRQEEHSREKVESWQQKMPTEHVANASDESDEITANQPSSSGASNVKAADVVANRNGVAIAPGAQKSDASVRAPKAVATLGFPVVKRSSLATMGKPRPARDAARNFEPSYASSPPIEHQPGVEQHAEQREAPEILSSPVDRPKQRGIADISEQSFLPPSFPESQLQTSTPNKPASRRKPSPIPDVPPSSPLSSPPSIRIYGRQRTTPISSSSLSQFPFTPTRNLTTKRLRSSSAEHEHIRKKGRTMPSLTHSDQTPAAIEQDVATAVAPKRPGQLPTLTELLASEKKAKIAKAASPKGKQRKISDTRPPPPDTGDPQEEEREGGNVIEQQLSREQQVDVGHVPFSIVHTWGTINDKLNTNLYEAASPAKSLSSLAASDSDSDGDDDRMNIDMDLTRVGGFDPPLASTQAQGTDLAKDGSLGWMGYNSQFDVDGKVDAVSRFMEKDVSVGGDFDLEYDGWMKDPSP